MVCGQKTEVYSRIVGFYRPVARWNKAKQEEFTERRTYKVDEFVKEQECEILVKH